MPVVKSAGMGGNLINPAGAYTKPLVNLTSSLPQPGQFANQIQPIVKLTNQAPVVQPVVRLTNQQTQPVAQRQVIQGQPVITGTAGKSTQADGLLGGQFGASPGAGVGGFSVTQPNFITRAVSNLFNREPGQTGTFTTGAGQARLPSGQAYAPQTARFDTEGFVNPTSFTAPRFDTERTTYPTPTPQLSRVNDRIVAIGGKKYFAPTLAGMLGGQVPEDTSFGNIGEEQQQYPPYTPYSYSPYSTPYSSYGDANSPWYGNPSANTLNWRVATG